MNEFVDKEKTSTKEVEAKPNPRFDQSNEEIDNTLEKDIPLGIIHILGGQNYPNLKNMILGEIRMIKQINGVLSVQSIAKKLRQIMSELGSITFSKVNLEMV